MLIHEEQAHLTWCPDARVMIIDSTNSWGIEAAGGNNRVVRIEEGKDPSIHFVPVGSTCIGKMCAAFRPVGGGYGYCGRGGPPSDELQQQRVGGPNVEDF